MPPATAESPSCRVEVISSPDFDRTPPENSNEAQDDTLVSVIVEVRVPEGLVGEALTAEIASRIPEMTLDATYEPVPAPQSAGAPSDNRAGESAVIVRGTVLASARQRLAAEPSVLGVWSDARVEGFES